MLQSIILKKGVPCLLPGLVTGPPILHSNPAMMFREKFSKCSAEKKNRLTDLDIPEVSKSRTTDKSAMALSSEKSFDKDAG